MVCMLCRTLHGRCSTVMLPLWRGKSYTYTGKMHSVCTDLTFHQRCKSNNKISGAPSEGCNAAIFGEGGNLRPVVQDSKASTLRKHERKGLLRLLQTLDLFQLRVEPWLISCPVHFAVLGVKRPREANEATIAHGCNAAACGGASALGCYSNINIDMGGKQW